eukprot:TRINITY_DN1668_c0_g3_i2.p1 TRINITY_DN1668_c0_g3~~TRINITY_DN1668_c0_g3_i2.p1  ORF type:complete len:302 (-),score=57.76 TRINITY_DN1668_c0_g3_i2:79-984(-)
MEAVADVIECARKELLRCASAMRAGAGATSTPALQRTPAVLATLSKALASYAGSPPHQLPLVVAHQRGAGICRLHLHAFTVNLPRRSNGGDVDDLHARQRFVLYGDVVEAVPPEPEHCLSASDVTNAWGDHRHFCVSYDSAAAGHGTALSFGLRALSSGAALVLVRAPGDNDRLEKALTAAGFDTSRLRACSRLVVVDNTHYIDDMTDDPVKGASRARDTVRHLTSECGLPAVRFIGEVQYPKRPGSRIEFIKKLLSFEQELANVFAQTPSAALCLYDTTEFPPSVVHAALHSHPTCIARI